MGFNFGAFAGGLAQGIQNGQKIALEQEQLQNARDKATAELKKQEQESLKRVATDVKAHNDQITTLTQKMNSATSQEDYNSNALAINSSIESFTKLYQAQIDNDLLPKQASNLYSQARLQGVEPVEIVKIKDYNNKDVEVPLPQSMASHPEDYALMENGKIGEAFMGTDKKIAGYNPTNYSPVKFKEEEASTSFGVIDGVEGLYTKQELLQATKDGKSVERSKDKPASTNVNVNVSSGAKSAVSSGEAMMLLSKSKNKGALDDSEVGKLWEVERNFLKDNATTEEKTQYSAVENSFKTIEGLNKTKKLYQDLVDKGLKGGIAQDLTVGVMKYIGSGGVMSDLSNITPEKFAEITGLDSGLVSQQMEIIKDLSGLSYTDKQMEAMQAITGSGKFKTNEAKINAINGYIGRVRRDTESLVKGDTRFARKYPHLAYSLGLKDKELVDTQPSTSKEIKIVEEDIGGVKYSTRTIDGNKQVQDPVSKKWFILGDK